MESDLLHFYQLDLLDFWRGQLTPRRLFTLITRLLRNEKSELATALNDGTRPMTRQEILLADLWTLTGKARWGKKAPDAHPIRAAQQKHRSSKRKQARSAALARAKERHARRRSLAGRSIERGRQ